MKRDYRKEEYHPHHDPLWPWVAGAAVLFCVVAGALLYFTATMA